MKKMREIDLFKILCGIDVFLNLVLIKLLNHDTEKNLFYSLDCGIFCL